MATLLTGLVHSTDVLQARKPISMEKMAAKLDDEAAFFLKLTQAIGGITTVGRMEHKFREVELRPQVVTVEANASAGATSINVDNPGYFFVNDMIYCPSTQELFVCDEAAAGGDAVAGSVKVRNKSGSGGITNAISSGAILINLEEAHAEGADIPAARAIKQVEKTVYLYQKDATLKHTDIEANEDAYGQNKLDEDRELEMISYLKGMNMVFYTGANTYEDTSDSDSGRRWYPAGLEYYLYSNGVNGSDLAAGLTLDALGGIIRPTKAHSASSAIKYALCGTNPWATISAYPNSAVRVSPGADKTWGVTVNELLTPFGRVRVAYDNVLSAENGLGDRMFIIDTKFIKQLQLRGLPLVMKRNVNNAEKIHQIIDVITGTRGFELKLADLHKEVFNL